MATRPLQEASQVSHGTMRYSPVFLDTDIILAARYTEWGLEEPNLIFYSALLCIDDLRYTIEY